MTFHDFKDGPLQGCPVELAGQPEGRGNVVKGATRLELVQKPQPLLSRRQWENAELSRVLL
jgi:hypothetical protein